MKTLNLKYYCVTDKSGFVSIVVGFTRPSPGSQSITSCSREYNSLDEVIEGEMIQSVPCKICGSLINASFIEEVSSVLIEKQLCHTCNFWTEKIGKDYLIINHECYHDGGRVPEKNICKGWSILGYGGREFKIETYDGKVISTNNLWSQGEVPPRFYTQLPNNAIFI